MPRISRRALVISSVTAALGMCAPELWPQGRTLGHITQPGRSAVGYSSDFSDELRLSRAYTLECAEAMPEAKYFFRPVPEVRTFGQQMVHIAESMRSVYEVFVEGKSAPTSVLSEAGKELVRSKMDVIIGLRDSFEYVDRASTRLSDSILQAHVQFLNNREVSKGRVLSFLLDHTTHHRAQTIVYMRLNGVVPPKYRA
jgi:uncharacterized damage-inducible protein DinB